MAHSLRSLAGPGAADSSRIQAGAATSSRLAPRLRRTFGSASNMADPFAQPCMEQGSPG